MGPLSAKIGIPVVLATAVVILIVCELVLEVVQLLPSRGRMRVADLQIVGLKLNHVTIDR